MMSDTKRRRRGNQGMRRGLLESTAADSATSADAPGTRHVVIGPSARSTRTADFQWDSRTTEFERRYDSVAII
jgi:hypothetical protein